MVHDNQGEGRNGKRKGWRECGRGMKGRMEGRWGEMVGRRDMSEEVGRCEYDVRVIWVWIKQWKCMYVMDKGSVIWMGCKNGIIVERGCWYVNLEHFEWETGGF